MNVVVLCGGVGAARFLSGLQKLIPTNDFLNVTAIVNTGDDDHFYGLFVCPDIDSILYHLGGVSDEVRGWGRKDETFAFMETLSSLGEDAWFNIGDRDLAFHILRTEARNAGWSLRDITRDLARRLDVADIDIVPMCEEKVTTTITTTDDRVLSMQEFFVREQCAPTIASIQYVGAPLHASPVARTALLDADIIVIAPSNPYLSIHPLFAIDEINSIVRKRKDDVIAISPIVSGHAIKGPLAAIMKDHGVDISPAGIAEIYSDYVGTLIIDEQDRTFSEVIQNRDVRVVSTNTIMNSDASRIALAQKVLDCIVSV